MRKFLLLILCALILSPVSYAWEAPNIFNLKILKNDSREIKSLLNSQVRYANRNNFKKFIATYDEEYKNADGFTLETYSQLVKDIWESYDKIKYGLKINDIAINDESAIVKVTETSVAEVPPSAHLEGVLQSEADSIYYLKKTNGDWKVISDKVLEENTSMLYGDALDLDIKLTAPKEIKAGEEYTASLEFNPPEQVVAVASIAKDKVEYPQKQPQEVYRKFPEDNLLERLFISNTDNANEYIVATIGLTKADVDELNIKLSLTGFGYKIIRVNVIPENSVVDDVQKE